MATLDKYAIGEFVTFTGNRPCLNLGDILQVVAYTIERDLDGNTYGIVTCRDENGDFWSMTPQQLERANTKRCVHCGDVITSETATDRNGDTIAVWRDSFGLSSCPARDAHFMHRAAVSA